MKNSPARLRPFHFIIPVGVALVATIGSWVTFLGMPWYATLAQPSWNPPSAVFGPVWTVLYVLIAMAMIFAYEDATPKQARALTPALIANAILNLTWSIMFFGAHDILAAAFNCALLALSSIVLVVLVKPISRTAAWMLVPYCLWVTFATVLNYAVWAIN